MSAMPQRKPLTLDDCLLWEADHHARCELIDGEIVAMTSASRNHGKISGNIYTALNLHLKDSPCVPYMETLKVRVDWNYYHPDVLVDCGDESHPYVADEPLIIFEVLSKSTRKTDLTVKLEDYQKIPSLQEYVVIEQLYRQISLFRRKDGWKQTNIFDGEVCFESIGLTMSVDDIYARVRFEE